MAKKTTEKTLKDKVIDSALELASAQAWENISFKEIIDHADVALADAHEYFDDKSDIIISYGRRIDRTIFDNCVFAEEEGASTLSCREKLFDLMMERFDVLNENRDAVLSILNSVKGDPKQLIISLPHIGRTMERMLDHVGIRNDGICGAVNVTGLSALYIHVLRVWKKDDSADMAKTMASLDKALEHAESLFNDFENKDFLGGLSSIKDSIFNRNKND